MVKKITVLSACLILFSGCLGKKTETDTIREAQSCLDQATQTTASQCMAKVEGIYTPAAYFVRCIGMFIQDGFDDPTRLTSAISNLTAGTGADQSVAVMASLAFISGSTASENSTNSQLASSYCQSSGSKGLIMLSSLASMATSIVTLADSLGDNLLNADGEVDPDALKNAFANPAVQNDSNTQSVIGGAAMAAYNSNCTNGQEGNGSFCTQFESAIAASGGNTQTLGYQVMVCYADPTASGCSGYGN